MDLLIYLQRWEKHPRLLESGIESQMSCAFVVLIRLPSSLLVKLASGDVDALHHWVRLHPGHPVGLQYHDLDQIPQMLSLTHPKKELEVDPDPC